MTAYEHEQRLRAKAERLECERVLRESTETERALEELEDVQLDPRGWGGCCSPAREDRDVEYMAKDEEHWFGRYSTEGRT